MSDRIRVEDIETPAAAAEDDVPHVGADGYLVLGPSPGGSSGLSWTQDVDNPLTSTSGLTTNGGTWSVVSGHVQNVSGSGFGRAVDGTRLSFAALCIVEVEVEIPATFNASSQTIGLLLTDAAASSNRMSFRIDANSGGGSAGTVRMERDGSASLGTVPYTIPAAGTWVKLRMVVIGQTAIGYVDGVKKYEGLDFAIGTASGVAYGGLMAAGSTTVRYRNLKCWSADLALPL